MNIQKLAKRLFMLEFLSDCGFEIDINSLRFEEISKELFHELEESEIITHKGFAEKIECSCGGFLEETVKDGKYFCGECANFEKISEKRKIYKADCESIFIKIHGFLEQIANECKELESFVPSKKGFFYNEISPIGTFKDVDLEIYFLHKQKHAQNFEKQNNNAKTLIFTLDRSVSNFADYYIPCSDVLNDDGSISLAKINTQLFGVLSKIYANQNLKKEAAKFHTLFLASLGKDRYKIHGQREKFIQDVMRDFQGVKRDYVEKLWRENIKE